MSILRSYIGEIALGIDRLFSEGKVSQKNKVMLYGMERYSFAMRTILQHRNVPTYAFVSEDEAEVIRRRREVQDFACRYFRDDRDVIKMLTVRESRDSIDEGCVLLLAGKDAKEKKRLLEMAGYQENKDLFVVYDFVDPEINSIIAGKREVDSKDLKNLGKEMLREVEHYCRENHIRGWVSGGTMLGTIRHKGFIPWDDDVDFFLPLPDYLKLVREYPADGRYYFSGFGREDENEFTETCGRMQDRETWLDHDIKIVRRLERVWLDVFPIIGLPEDEEERRIFFASYKETEKSILQEFYAKDGDLEVFRRRYGELSAFLTRYDFDSSEYVGVLGTKYETRDCTHRSVYDQTIQMPFEDIEVSVPAGYEEYLCNLYGSDWNTPPEEGKRVSLHRIKGYWA